MKILVACEESQAVTTELRRIGHDAFSCDVLPASGNHPEWHMQCDVLSVLDRDWDAVIAFPPCTHLAVSGARWFREKKSSGEQGEAIAFFIRFTELHHVPYVAIENPVGIMSSHYRKPSQIIQPWMFGHGETKATCLWLKNLPLLKPTNIVDGREPRIHHMPPSPDRARLRSKTYEGIARAMATQWFHSPHPYQSTLTLEDNHADHFVSR